MTKKGHIINLRVKMFFEFEKVMQTGILVRIAQGDCVVHFLCLDVKMRRRGAEALENTLFEYLDGVFTTNLNTINKYVDVENNTDVKEVLRTMSGLGESLENRSVLNLLIELVRSKDLTEARAAEKAGMTLEEFKQKMQEVEAE